MNTSPVTAIESAKATLRVAMPEGSEVTVYVTDHRRTRNGLHTTTVSVLNVFDGHIADWSGFVATVTGNGRATSDGGFYRVKIAAGAYPGSAARQLVAELARALYSNAEALSAHVMV